MSGDGDEHVPLGTYFAWFAFGLLAFYILMAVLRQFLSSNLIGVSLIGPFFVSSGLAERFLSKEKRVPTNEERRSLVMGGLGIFLFINTGLLLLAFAGGALSDIGVDLNTLLAISLSVLMSALVLNYLLMRWAYGGLLRKRAKKLGLYDEDQGA